MNESNAGEASALLAALSGFSERAGHDLTGPLSQASSLLALFIRRYRTQIDTEADQLLDYLQDASARMEDVSRGVRKFMETARKPPAWAQVDLNEVLNSALQRLAGEIQKTGAEIAVVGSLPLAKGDASQLTILFENLLGNCLKFRDPEAAPQVRISTESDGAMHSISIRDEGIGVEAQSHEVLFVAFRRLNGREYPGPGLGLATARMIVEMHGGRIGLVPVTGAGTCVRFTVPRP